jgi:hypothetical protein
MGDVAMLQEGDGIKEVEGDDSHRVFIESTG